MRRRTRVTGCIVAALAIVLLLALLTTACSRDTTNAAGLGDTYEFQSTWNGVNGVNNNLPGASTLWILSGGGQGSYTGASLHVVYSNGATADITGEVKGQGGSVHFTVPAVSGATVTSAVAYYNADQEQTNSVVTISHVIEGGTTTTTAEDTTTTTVEETTTTSPEETTTTTAEETTTTTVQDTTTTTAEQTTTTLAVTTTTAEETTTTTVKEESSTTTTGQQTTTTAEGTTSTTAEEETSTTGRGLTTVTGIQTGGGGTAGSNGVLWTVGILAGALALGVLVTALRPGLKRK